jgi:osmotically-inducible protein OsmY
VSCAQITTCGSDSCAGDRAITAAVELRLDRHPELEIPDAIDVQTKNHVVYLYGLVDTTLESSVAESLARDTPGVDKVVSLIALNNP